MAKKNTVSDPTAAIELLQAQNEALADEVAALAADLDAERQARKSLESVAAGSARIFTAERPATPAPLPVVTIGGRSFRFRIGAFRLGATKYTAAEAAQNEALLLTILEKYPSLLEAQ